MADFIQQLSPKLADYYQQARHYCYDDPEGSLVKLRSCAVILVDLIYKFHHLDLDDNLCENINGDLIAPYLPPSILKKLDDLRIQGNKGAHPENSFKDRNQASHIAIQCLQKTHQVSAWLYQQIYGKTQLSKFITPSGDNNQLYADAIVNDNAEAQYAVGMLFKQRLQHAPKTNNTPEEWLDCVYWLKKAVAKKHPAACYHLGLLYIETDSIQRHANKGHKLIEQAALQDYPDALYTMGEHWFVDKAYAKALVYFNKAAKQEHLGALNRLVQMHYEGLGVVQDNNKAFLYAHHAAQAGYASAQFKLAYLYQAGLGVKKNPQAAFAWYQKAAEGDYADAQLVLFKYYSNGLWVKKDLDKALYWLKQAQHHQHAGAYYYLGLAYQRGIGVPVDPLHAINLFKLCLKFDTDHQYPQARLAFEAGINQLRQQAVSAASAQQKTLPAYKKKRGRNDLCPCGSGKKYKKCCLNR